MCNIKDELFALADTEYKAFQQKLMPTVSQIKVIGVRTPALRLLAKELHGTKAADEFLNSLPHEYYEEDNLHAFLLEKIKDFDELLAKTESFLPYIDNWATCDSLNPEIFAKNPELLLPKIEEWLKSDKTYVVRYAIKLLMTYFLDERFDEVYLLKVASVKSEEYYIKMMQSWYFATALAKQYNSAVKYIENRLLSDFVHNKAIQKARESYRIDEKTKEYLKMLK